MAELPEWQPLSGAEAPVPHGHGDGRVVALVATQRAIAEEWAPGTAVDLVRTWSNHDERVVLVDGGLEHPTLHEVVGLPNREGLSDATLHGASVDRVSHPVDDGLFFLISAGTPVGDANSVVRSPRWYRLAAGMAEAGVTLVLYLRDGDPGTAAFLGSASDIVVLSPSGDGAPSAVRDLEPLVRAVTGPAGGDTPASESIVGAALASDSDSGRAGMRNVVFVVIAIVVLVALAWLAYSALG
jgi:energy-converting hydrogenase Eha subunit B